MYIEAEQRDCWKNDGMNIYLNKMEAMVEICGWSRDMVRVLILQKCEKIIYSKYNPIICSKNNRNVKARQLGLNISDPKRDLNDLRKSSIE